MEDCLYLRTCYSEKHYHSSDARGLQSFGEVYFFWKSVFIALTLYHKQESRIPKPRHKIHPSLIPGLSFHPYYQSALLQHFVVLPSLPQLSSVTNPFPWECLPYTPPN